MEQVGGVSLGALASLLPPNLGCFSLIARIFLQPGARTAPSSAETAVQHAPRLHDAKTLCILHDQPRKQSLEKPTWAFCSPFWVSLHPLALNPDPRAELACASLQFLPPWPSPAQDVSQELHLGFEVFFFPINGCKIRQMRQSSLSLLFTGEEFPCASLKICFCSTTFQRKQGS